MALPPINPTAINVASHEAHTFWREITMRKNWTIKNIERVLAYGAAVVAATNGFSQAGLPANVRDTMLIASSIILAAIHVSTPKV